LGKEVAGLINAIYEAAETGREVSLGSSPRCQAGRPAENAVIYPNVPGLRPVVEPLRDRPAHRRCKGRWLR
jgi:hypothetical protein